MAYGLLLLSAIVIARFDGSLKLPRDPGFQVKGLHPVASCAATVAYGSHCTFGGRILEPLKSTSSAEVEYEGLLLALDGLIKVDGKFETSRAIVEGDCKTVINQMRNQAQARKLESYMNKAREMLQQIPFPVEFRHIPREQNVICDQLCGQINLYYEQQRYNGALSDLKEIEKQCQSKDRPLDYSLPLYIENYFGKGLIQFSKRPTIYRLLARLAVFTRDYESLVAIGELLEAESQKIWAFCHEGKRPLKSQHEILAVEGLTYQHFGYTKLGTMEKKVARNQRRQRHLLERHRQVVDNTWSLLRLTCDSDVLPDLDINSLFWGDTQGLKIPPAAMNKSFWWEQ